MTYVRTVPYDNASRGCQFILAMVDFDSLVAVPVPYRDVRGEV